jgi:hypothetical protein
MQGGDQLDYTNHFAYQNMSLIYCIILLYMIFMYQLNLNKSGK